MCLWNYSSLVMSTWGSKYLLHLDMHVFLYNLKFSTMNLVNWFSGWVSACIPGLLGVRLHNSPLTDVLACCFPGFIPRPLSSYFHLMPSNGDAFLFFTCSLSLSTLPVFSFQYYIFPAEFFFHAAYSFSPPPWFLTRVAFPLRAFPLRVLNWIHRLVCILFDAIENSY